MKTPTRVILADDHGLFREGLRLVLALHPDIKVVAEVQNADELLPTLKRAPCDLLLLDLNLDRNVLEDIPALAAQTAVVVVTAAESPEQALSAMRSGARAVVLKRYAAETLMQAVNAVRAGQVWMPPSLQQHVAAGLREPARTPLTTREREIVRHVAMGLRNAEVARKLFITEQTVKTHLNNIFQKLAIRDRVELTLYAVREGLVSIDERAS